LIFTGSLFGKRCCMQQTVIVDQLVGQVIGKKSQYRVDRLLGQSRLNAVYLARNLNDQTMVALTLFITPEHFSLDAYQRFTQRFTAAAPALVTLQHPHILPVHEFGEQYGYPYLITPYLTNGSLADSLRQKQRFSYEEVLEFLEQIAPAIQLAHSRGLIHGTLKPANLVLNDQKQVLVAGFGLMHMLQLSGVVQSRQPYAHLLSLAETLLVAPEYLAPEVVEGRAIDKRSDVYALGCILFELLSGSPPFKGTDPMAVAQMHVQEQLPSLHSLVPELPLALVSVIHQSLERDPQRRFQQVNDVLEAFSQVVMGVTNPHQNSVASKGLLAGTSLRTTQNTPAEDYASSSWQLTPPIVTGKLAALSPKSSLSTSARMPAQPAPTARRSSPPVKTGPIEVAPATTRQLPPPVPNSYSESDDAPTIIRSDPPRSYQQDARGPAPRMYEQEPSDPRMEAPRPYQQDARGPAPRMYEQEPRDPRMEAPRYQQDARGPAPRMYEQEPRDPRMEAPRSYQQEAREPREPLSKLPDEAVWWGEGDQQPQVSLRLAQPDSARAQSRKRPDASNARSANKGRGRASQSSSSGLNRRQVLAIVATGGVVAAGALLVTNLHLLNMGHPTASANNQGSQTGATTAQKGTTTTQGSQTGTTNTQASQTGAKPQQKATQPAQMPGHTGTAIGSASQLKNTSQQFSNPADGKASLLVHLPNGTFVAYKQACTHEGVAVNYDPGTQTFICPAHGAIFDPAKSGAVLQGPATSPLPMVGVKVNSDGSVTAL
jgi:serine/threonine protein kinase/Rieske Fe-S protein